MILNVANTVVSHKPLESRIVWAKGDSAASSNYWRPQDKHVLDDIEQCKGPFVQLPNNEMIASEVKFLSRIACQKMRKMHRYCQNWQVHH